MPLSSRSADKDLAPVWVLLAIIVLAAPLAIGSVHPPAQAALAVASGMLLVVHARLRKMKGRRVAPGPLPLVVAAGGAWSLLQTVPLPMPLVRLVSPAAAQLYEEMAIDAPARFGSISADPVATMVAAAQLFTLACVLCVTLDLARHQEARRRLLMMPALAGMGVLVVGAAQLALGMDGPYGIFNTPSKPILTTSFINSNHGAAALSLGAFALFGLALDAQERRQMVNHSAMALACALGVFACGSHAAVGALVVGIALTAGLLWRSVRASRADEPGHHTRRGSRTMAVVALATMIPLMLFAVQGPDVGGMRDNAVQALALKAEGIQQSFEAIADYWLTGLGRGAFVDVFPRHKTSLRPYTFTNPENIEVLLALEWGVPFALLYLGAFAFIIGRWILRNRGAAPAAALGGLVAIGLHNQADFNLEVLGVALPFAALLGAARDEDDPPEMTAADRRVLARRSTSLALRAGALVAVLGALPALWALGHARAPSFAVALAVTDADKRVDALKQHLKRHPSDYIAALLLSRTLRAQDNADPNEVMRWINRAMFLNPTYADTHADAGRALWVAGRGDQAALEFAAALDRGPYWPVTALFGELLRRGFTVEQLWVAFASLGPRWVCDYLQAYQRVGMAEACLRRLVDEHPDDAGALAALAERALARGEPDLAEERARAALGIDPGNGDATLVLSKVLLAQGRIAEADDALERARRARPDPVEVERARYQRAIAAGETDNARRVLVSLSEAISRRGGNLAEVMLLEAQLEEKSGNSGAALLHYRNAARAHPSHPEAALSAARLILKAGDEDSAISFLREIALAHPHPAYTNRLNELVGMARRQPRKSSPVQ